MRTSFKLKSVVVASLLAAGTLAHAAPAVSKAPQKAQDSQPAKNTEKEDKGNSAIAQSLMNYLLASKNFYGCDFEFEGSINGDKSSIDMANLNCTIQLSEKNDLVIPLNEQDVNAKGEKTDFGINVVAKAKGMYLQLVGQIVNGVKTVSLRSYSEYAEKTNTWITKPIEVSASVANGEKSLNSELVAIRLYGIDAKLTEVAGKPGTYTVNGSCKADKKIYSWAKKSLVYVPAECYVNGTFGNGQQQFDFGFKNSAKTPTVMP